MRCGGRGEPEPPEFPLLKGGLDVHGAIQEGRAKFQALKTQAEQLVTEIISALQGVLLGVFNSHIQLKGCVTSHQDNSIQSFSEMWTCMSILGYVQDNQLAQAALRDVLNLWNVHTFALKSLYKRYSTHGFLSKEQWEHAFANGRRRLHGMADEDWRRRLEEDEPEFDTESADAACEVELASVKQSADKGKTFVEFVKYSTIVMVGPVPVELGVRAFGAFGFGYGATLCALPKVKATGTIGPVALDLGVEGYAAVTLAIVKAGLNVRVNLLKHRLTAEAEVALLEFPLKIKPTVKRVQEPLDVSINAFFEHIWFKCKFWSCSTYWKRYEKNIGTLPLPGKRIEDKMLEKPVKQENRAPEVSPVDGGMLQTPEDTSVSYNLRGTDSDGDSLTWRLHGGGPQRGVAVLEDARTGRITYTPNHNVCGEDGFEIVASDGVLTSDPGMVTVQVVCQADTPTLEVWAAKGDEDTCIGLRLSARLTDTDGSEKIEVTISGMPSFTEMRLDRSHSSLVDGSKRVVTDAISIDLQHGSAQFCIKPCLHCEEDFSLAITATATETANGHSSSTTRILPVDVVPVNDAPVFYFPGGTVGNTAFCPVHHHIDEDGMFFSTGEIQVSDIDNDHVIRDHINTRPRDGTMTLKLSCDHGFVNLFDNRVALDHCDAGFAKDITCRGALRIVNAILGHFQYNGGNHYNDLKGGPDKISFSITDNGNSGKGTALSDQGCFHISLQAINDGPVIILPGDLSSIKILEGTGPPPISGIQVDDVDVDETAGGEMKMELYGDNGNVALTPFGSGVSKLSFSGSLAFVNAMISTFFYMPHDWSLCGHLITVSVADQGNTGRGDRQGLFDSRQIGVNVYGKNRAPVIHAPRGTSLVATAGEPVALAGAVRVTDTDAKEGIIAVQLCYDGSAVIASDPKPCIISEHGITRLTAEQEKIERRRCDFDRGTDQVPACDGSSILEFFVGSLGMVNSALTGLVCIFGHAGDATLSIAVSDCGNSGMGGAKSSEHFALSFDVLAHKSSAFSSNETVLASDLGDPINSVVKHQQCIANYSANNSLCSYNSSSGALTLTRPANATDNPRVWLGRDAGREHLASLGCLQHYSQPDPWVCLDSKFVDCCHNPTPVPTSSPTQQPTSSPTAAPTHNPTPNFEGNCSDGAGEGCEGGAFCRIMGTTAICTACFAGRFSSTLNATVCTFCPADQYTPGLGYDACIHCPADYHTQGQTGKTTCHAITTVAPTSVPTPSPTSAATLWPTLRPTPVPTPVPAAVAADTTTPVTAAPLLAAIVPATDLEVRPCSQDSGCSPGTYCDASEHSGSCQLCEAGKFSNATNASSCLACGVAQFTPGMGHTICLRCPAGYWTLNLTSQATCVASPAPSPTATPTHSPTPAPTYRYNDSECTACRCAQCDKKTTLVASNTWDDLAEKSGLCMGFENDHSRASGYCEQGVSYAIQTVTPAHGSTKDYRTWITVTAGNCTTNGNGGYDSVWEGCRFIPRPAGEMKCRFTTDRLAPVFEDATYHKAGGGTLRCPVHSSRFEAMFNRTMWFVDLLVDVSLDGGDSWTRDHQPFRLKSQNTPPFVAFVNMTGTAYHEGDPVFELEDPLLQTAAAGPRHSERGQRNPSPDLGVPRQYRRRNSRHHANACRRH